MSEPRATYRLQLGPDLTFAGAAALVGYLADLGVSHLYLSPILTARPGSTHGYDVADPATVSAVLGGEDGLRALAATARAAGLGLVADLVPNHVGTGWDTPLWRELLRSGPAGPSGRVFDVDWRTPLPGAAEKVVVPALGDQYGEVLARDELQVVEEDGEYRVAYFDHRFPLRAESQDAVARAGGPEALRTPPHVHALLEQQHYRLVHWRAAQELVNYRRFFSIDELAAVRVEDPEVFATTHGTVLRLVADGVLDGLRVDHPDGLRDPARYFARLAEATGGVWTVAEKILAPDEAVRDWAVAGTTGYEFTNQVLGLFVDPAAEPVLDALDEELGGTADWEFAAWKGRNDVLDGELRPDVRRLARLLWPVVQEHLDLRDVGDERLTDALVDLLQELPVYRAYVDPDTGEATDADRALLDRAVAAASATYAERAPLHAFLGRLLAGEAGRDAATLEVLGRFPQVASATMAKGVEDTAFYRFRRLLAVNEVGGEPGRLGLAPGAFHAAQAARQERTPAGMVTTATHDTKRGEDTRLRMAALSELPGRFAEVARALAPGAPHPQVATLVVQTLVGVWPLTGDPGAVRERLQAYLVKAQREEKQQTSWRDPDEAYEAATARFADQVLDDPPAGLAALAGDCAEIAMVSGLAQVLLRCTVPGVPDTYQGTEGWDLSLVDPDNRRPVDFPARRALLAALDAQPPDPAALWASRADGRVKTWVLSRALRARAGGSYTPLPASGPLADHVVAFARGGDLVTVAPRLAGAVTAGATRPATGGTWAGTAVVLPAGTWTDLLTGETREGGEAPLDEVLAALPVALLRRG